MKIRARLDERNRLTIPKEIVETLKLHEGDTVELDVVDGLLHINKREEK